MSVLSALAFAGAAPEHVPEVTSMGPARPGLRETPLGRFSFRRVKPEMLFGDRRIDMGGGMHAFVADAEKAFLDLAYLQPGGDDPAWIDELRLNTAAFSIPALAAAAARAASPKLERAARHVRALAQDPALAYHELDA